MAAVSKNINRYPGVKPFSTSENFLFFGRETDIDALNSLIFVNQTVILYGKSGYGKSSLINAGIIPRLQKNEEWVYFSIRFNNFSEKETEKNLSPLQTTSQRLSETLDSEKGNLLDNLILNENSFWYWIKQIQLQKHKGKFIIFFDQFEELFTYSKEQILEFSEQLSQLLYTTVPVNFKRKIAEFEHNNSLSDEQHDFLYEKPDVKVIFSIRSDRLALLNQLKDKHPSILQNAYELDALNNEDAKGAIIKPAELPQELGFATPDFKFTKDAVNKIIDSIANPQDGKIETATLQIVCRFVENSVVKEKNITTISNAELGNITDIFQQYYRGILDKLTITEKKQAQKLIEDELIEGNRRNPLSENYIKSKFGISDNLLSVLEQSSILKKERDARGNILYEVSHDSLVEAINKIAESRREKETTNLFEQEKEKAEQEKKRADELEALKNKAEFRYKLAVGAFFTLFVLSGIIVFFIMKSQDLSTNNENLRNQLERGHNELEDLKYAKTKLNNEIETKKQELKNETESLDEARKRADTIAYNAKVLFFNSQVQEARRFLNYFDEYIRLKDREAALTSLNKASELLQTTDSLPPKEKNLRKVLLNMIEQKRKQLN